MSPVKDVHPFTKSGPLIEDQVQTTPRLSARPDEILRSRNLTESYWTSHLQHHSPIPQSPAKFPSRTRHVNLKIDPASTMAYTWRNPPSSFHSWNVPHHIYTHKTLSNKTADSLSPVSRQNNFGTSRLIEIPDRRWCLVYTHVRRRIVLHTVPCRVQFSTGALAISPRAYFRRKSDRKTHTHTHPGPQSTLV